MFNFKGVFLMKKIILLESSLQSKEKSLYSLTKAQIVLLLNKYGLNVDIKIISIGNKNKVHKIIYKDDIVLIKEYGIPKRELIHSYIYSKLGSFGNSKNTLLKEIESADYIWDMSNGEGFNDGNGVKSYILSMLNKKLVLNKNKPLILMPQSIGPFDSKIREKYARKVIESAREVFVLDGYSKDYIEQDLRCIRRVNVLPDLSYYYEEKQRELVHENNKKNRITVGINISSKLDKELITYKSMIMDIIDELLKDSRIDILLIPYEEVYSEESHEDYRFCNSIAYGNNNERVESIGRYYEEEALRRIIHKCDFLIGSSPIACIDAISMLVPTYIISGNLSFIDNLKRRNLEDCIGNLQKSNKKEIIDRIIIQFNNREEIRRRLYDVNYIARKKIEGIIECVDAEYKARCCTLENDSVPSNIL